MSHIERSLTHSGRAPTARPEVECLQAYRAPLEGRRDMLRLDFNENTVGPSPRVMQALQAIPARQIATYPEYSGLRQAVITNLEQKGLQVPLHLEQVGLFNGVDAGIHAVFHAYGSKNETLLTTAPTFGYYAPCAYMQGMKIIAVPHKLPGFRFPLEAIYANLANNPRILIICNPNNPTGTRLPPEQVLELCAAAPRTLVVVDEVYEPFGGDSVLPHLDPELLPNLMVLQSLAKSAGLAGLRLGFSIGSSAVIDRVSRVTGPYDINSFAVTAALAALSDQDYVDYYVGQVLEARAWILKRLCSAGVNYHADGGNYLLIWPQRPVDEVECRLRKEGILVRPMYDKPQIKGAMRVSLGTICQMQRFWSVFAMIEGLDIPY